MDINQDYVFKFHKDFYNPISEGVKTTTIRADSKPVVTGDYYKAVFNETNNCLVLEILEHYAIKYDDLSLNHAYNEGYIHTDLLKHELLNIYPDLTSNDYVYIYKFKAYNYHETNRFIKELGEALKNGRAKRGIL